MTPPSPNTLTWLLGGGALALLGFVAFGASQNSAQGGLNAWGIVPDWQRSWVAFTPDTYGELVSRVAHPDKDVDWRRATTEWTDAVGLYQSLLGVREAPPHLRANALGGDVPKQVQRRARVKAVIEHGRPREILTAEERELLKALFAAYEAYYRLSTAPLRVADLALVLATSVEHLTKEFEYRVAQAIADAKNNVQFTARQASRKKHWTGEKTLAQNRLDDLLAERERLRLRGVVPLRYLKRVRL